MVEVWMGPEEQEEDYNLEESQPGSALEVQETKAKELETKDNVALGELAAEVEEAGHFPPEIRPLLLPSCLQTSSLARVWTKNSFFSSFWAP